MLKRCGSFSLVGIVALALARTAGGAPKYGAAPMPAPQKAAPAAAAPRPAPAAQGPKLEWSTSFVGATRQARLTDKVILAYFEGSDWCEWCKKLDREVLQTPMFVEWAKANVIPLRLDYPSPEKPQQRSVAKQNEILAATYSIGKTPTILILDADGEVIDRIGYDGACLRDDEQRGAPVQAIAKLTSIVEKRPTGQQLKEMTFAQAAETTQKSGQFVMVLLTRPDSKLAMDTRDRMLKSTKLGKFVNANMAFVNLTWPSDGDASPEAKWFKTFTDANQIGPAPLQVIVMTYGAHKVQAKIMAVDQIDGLINQIAKELPKFDYTGNWITDYRKAQSISAQSGRDMLLSFTSLDSSEWCQKLDTEIYQQEAFKEYARQNLVLVRIDFPKTTEQPPELKLQNQSLAEQFNIRGYPSMILINPKGQKVGTAKYMPGGPAAFIKEMDDLRKKDFDRRTLASEQVEVKKSDKPAAPK